MKKLLFLLLFVSLLFYSYPSRLDGKVKGEFHRLSIEDGLSQNTVHCIHQDSSGFMWFGTRVGLNRYDGYTFKKYYHEPQNPDSLSDNTVVAICEDQSGVLWFGTFRGGVNRFDRKKESFTRFMADPGDPGGLDSNFAFSLVEDKAGVIWIGTTDKGLNKFDRGKNKIIRVRPQGDGVNDSELKGINSICAARSGLLWIGTPDRGLLVFDPEKEIFTGRLSSEPGNPQSLSSNEISCVFEDSLGFIWAGTYNFGLNRLDPKTGHCTRFSYDPANPYSLSNNSVYCAIESKSGTIWAGSWDGGGLNKFDPKENKFFLFKSDPNNRLSLSQDNINSLFESKTGILWVGTANKGISKYTLSREEFVHYRKNPDNLNSLSHNTVMTIHTDGNGILWVGTRGGGLNKFDPGKGLVTHYRGDESNVQTKVKNYVNAVHEDRRGVLWIGTTGGIYHYDPQKDRLKLWESPDKGENRLNRCFIKAILEDRFGVFWFGTMDGLYAYNPENGKISLYRPDPENPGSLSHRSVRTIYETRSGTIWVGTFYGLNRFDRKRGGFIRYSAEPGNPKSITCNNIISLCEDHRETLWIGTNGGGLNKFVAADNTFAHYDTGDGLPDNVIYGILEDDSGFLWLSTNRGLSRFDPRRETFANYTVRDGLQSDEFSAGAYHKSKSGRLYFGGINGFNAFYPQNVLKNLHVPPVVVTGIKIYTGSTSSRVNFRLYKEAGTGPQPMKVDETIPSRLKNLRKETRFSPMSSTERVAPATHDVTKRYSSQRKSSHENKIFTLSNTERAQKDEIVLSYEENTFTIEFAALDYTNPHKNQYAYMLAGLDEDWIYSGNKREAVYVGLKPGEYVFRAKGSNNSGIWNEKGLTRRIKILHPPSRITLFFMLPAACIVIVFFLLFFVIRKKKRSHRKGKELDIDRIFASYSFSNRENEIIRLLLQGKSKKEIEEELFISPHTVKNNIYNIYRKLGIRNRIEIIKLFRDTETNV